MSGQPLDCRKSTPTVADRVAADTRSSFAGRFRSRALTSPLALALEPRFMFDAAGAATGGEAAVDAAAQEAADQQTDNPQTDDGTDPLADALSSAAPPADRKEVVFVDPNIGNFDALVSGVHPAAEVVVLDPTGDGLSQIADYLSEKSDINAIHIVSHGEAGAVTLGGISLDLTAVEARAGDLATIGDALTADGDILFYGCDVAAGDKGAAFVSALAEATNADVAASTDDTGAADQGGDWHLEAETGDIEAEVAFDETAQASFDGVLASVSETENNNNRNQAQQIDDSEFDLTHTEAENQHPDLPTVKISGTLAGVLDRPDFFAISLEAGQTLYADIDGGRGGSFLEDVDTTLAVFGQSGGALAFNDDSGIDPGSISILDAKLEFTAATAGTYYVRVSNFNPFDRGTYTLYLSKSPVVGDPPELTADTDEVDFTERDGNNGSQGGPQFLNGVDFTLTDQDSDSFSEISIKIVDSTGGDAVDGDSLRVRPQDHGNNNSELRQKLNAATITGNNASNEITVTAAAGQEFTAAEVEAILEKLRLRVAEDSPALSERNLVVSVTDAGDGAGSDPATSDPLTIAVNVEGVNDTPTWARANRFPDAQATTSEDMPLDDVFASVRQYHTDNTSNLNQFRLLDRDDDTRKTGGTPQQLTLAVDSGTLSFTAGSGVTLVSGNGTDTLVVEGSINALRNFVNGQRDANLSYTPNADFNGTDTLTMTVTDQGDLPIQGDPKTSEARTIEITVDPVNDAPVNTVPEPQIVAEDTSLVFSAANGNGLSVGDVDAGDGDVTATLSVADGILAVTTGGGATIAGDGSGTVTITGTVSAVNAALASVTYSPAANFNGADTLTLTTNDQGNTGDGGALTDTDTVGITVTPVNDAPTIAGPTGPLSVDPADTITISDLAIGDVDVAIGPDGTYTVTLAVGGGSLAAVAAVPGVTVTGAGTGTLTLGGTLADLNSALAGGIAYTAPTAFDGASVTLTAIVSDNGNAGTGGPLTAATPVDITVTGSVDPTLPVTESGDGDGGDGPEAATGVGSDLFTALDNTGGAGDPNTDVNPDGGLTGDLPGPAAGDVGNPVFFGIPVTELAAGLAEGTDLSQFGGLPELLASLSPAAGDAEVPVEDVELLLFGFPVGDLAQFLVGEFELSTLDSRDGLLNLVAASTDGGTVGDRLEVLRTLDRLGLFADGSIGLAELQGEIGLFGLTLGEMAEALEGVDLNDVDSLAELQAALGVPATAELIDPAASAEPISMADTDIGTGAPAFTTQIASMFDAFDRDATALGSALAQVTPPTVMTT